MGASLAEFDYKDEEMKIDEFLPGDVIYWIGLTDRGVEGTFRWEESHQEPSYTNWLDGQPSNSVVDEDCVNKWFFGDHHGGWNDEPCWKNGVGTGYHFHALCQKPK